MVIVKRSNKDSRKSKYIIYIYRTLRRRRRRRRTTHSRFSNARTGLCLLRNILFRVSQSIFMKLGFIKDDCSPLSFHTRNTKGTGSFNDKILQECSDHVTPPTSYGCRGICSNCSMPGILRSMIFSTYVFLSC